MNATFRFTNDNIDFVQSKNGEFVYSRNRGDMGNKHNAVSCAVSPATFLFQQCVRHEFLILNLFRK